MRDAHLGREEAEGVAVAWDDPEARAAVQRTQRRARLGLVASLLAFVVAVVAASVAALVEDRTGVPSPTWVVAAVSLVIMAPLFGLPISAAGLVRARRRRRILTAHPWRRVRIDLQTIRAHRSARVLMLVPAQDGEMLVHLPNVLLTSPGRAGLRDRAEVEVAGEEASRLVLRGPDDARLFTAVRARTGRAERRWRAAAGW